MRVGTTRVEQRGAALFSGTDVWVLTTPRDPEFGCFDARGEVGSVLSHYVPSAALKIARDRRGKPHLENAPGLHFSLARSAGVTLVAVSCETEVGIDVEKRVDRGLRSLPAHALGEEEREALCRFPEAARDDAFLTYWVRKEAVLKAAGVGLGVEPKLVEVSAPTEHPVVRSVPSTLGPVCAWTLVDLEVPGCAAAVALRRPSATVRLIECWPRMRSTL